MFNRIFKYGSFPKGWSASILVFNHKKGDKKSPNNYGGISLLDVFGKVQTEELHFMLTFMFRSQKRKRGSGKGTQRLIKPLCSQLESKNI